MSHEKKMRALKFTVIASLVAVALGGLAMAAGPPSLTPFEAGEPIRATALNRYFAILVDHAVRSESVATDARVVASLAAPAGTVIFWYRAESNQSVPAGWTKCDGSTIDAPGSAFHGKPSPNLMQRFARGGDNAGASGGADQVLNDHSHSIKISTAVAGAHTHNLPIGKANGDKGQVFVKAFPGTEELETLADATGYGGANMEVYTGTQTVEPLRAALAGSHSHAVEGATLTGGGTVEFVPRYVELLPLMKL